MNPRTKPRPTGAPHPALPHLWDPSEDVTGEEVDPWEAAEKFPILREVLNEDAFQFVTVWHFPHVCLEVEFPDGVCLNLWFHHPEVEFLPDWSGN